MPSTAVICTKPVVLPRLSHSTGVSILASRPTIYTSGEIRIHPLEEQVCEEINDYFLLSWPFRTDEARSAFIRNNYPRLACLSFPAALDSRITHASRLITLLYLLADVLDSMPSVEASEYGEHLISIMDNVSEPETSSPIEFLSQDLWESMRQCDDILADDIMTQVKTFIRERTDALHLCPGFRGSYSQFQLWEIKKLLSAVMRFSMALRLTSEESKVVEISEQNTCKHMSAVQDIYCWQEKPSQATGRLTGPSPLESLVSQHDLPYQPMAQRLWSVLQHWEDGYARLAVKVLNEDSWSPAMQRYVEALGWQMSGHRRWIQEIVPSHVMFQRSERSVIQLRSRT